MNQTLIDLFQAHVSRDPHHTAILGGADYGTLDARSTAAAKGLVAAGFGRGDVIALRMKRSEDQIVAMLAALKAGGTFFPLGTTTPRLRLTRLLQDANAAFLMSDPNLPAAPKGGWTEIYDLTGAPSSTSLPPPADDTPMCLFHTSGTTGQPKLMPITAAGVIRIAHAPDYVAIDATTRISHLSNPAFDAISFEIWGALLNGATLVIFSDDEVRDPARLADKIQSCAVTTTFLTTAWFNLLAAQRPDILLNLRDILFGGEAACAKTLHRLMCHPRAGKTRVSNIYGPTECTTFALVYPISPTLWARPDHPATVPVGKPLRETGVVIAADDKPALDAQWGEILLSGQGLIAGYCGQVEGEQPSRFTTLPDHAGTRFYRTGDRGRRMNGHIECGGRLDHQVKLRGFRIELPEVEAALLAHENVSAAACKVTEQHLIAFIAAPETLDISALRSELAAVLPAFMLPQHIVRQNSLPLNDNGKTDRAALVAPPLNAWPDVAEGQTFLQAGGDSLAAALYAQHLRDAGKQVSVADLLSQRPLDDILQTAPDIEPFDAVHDDTSDQYPATSEQRGLWLAQQMQPASTAYNISLRFEFASTIDSAQMSMALRRLVDMYPALRTAFRIDHAGDLIADIRSPWHDVVEPAPDAQTFFDQPFDMAAGRVIRAAVLGKTLLICLHHSVIDGAGLNVLLDDLAQLYRGETPVPSGNYAHYARQQRDILQTDDYMTRRQARAAHLMARPFESEDSTNLPAKNTGHLYEFNMPYGDLAAIAQQNHQTPFACLLSAFAFSLARIGMGPTISLGVPIGVRPAQEMRTVGMFVNTQVVRFDGSNLHDLDSWNAHVQSEIAALYDAHDVAFEHTLEDLRANGETGPLFDVMFVHENTRYDLPGINARFCPPEVVTPRFPLTLFVTETDAGLHCQIEFDTTRFDLGFVRNLATTFDQTLALMGNSDAVLPRLPNVINLTDTACQDDPDKLAVACGADTLSFAQLHHHADQYASALHQLGVQVGDRVGFALSPCIAAVPALLGILRLGAVWVPMDPTLPVSRLDFIAKDAEISAVISDKQLFSGSDIPHLSPSQINTKAPTNYPTPALTPTSLAYIIYTSGSSGTPKGVSISHGALSNYLDHCARAYFDDPDLQGAVVSTSFSFDATVTSLIAPLCCAKHVRLLTDNVAQELTTQAQGNVPLLFKLTPTHLIAMRAYLDTAQHAGPWTGRHLFIVGGEQLSAALVSDILRHLPNAEIINEYGPTEATVGCSIARASAAHIPQHLGMMTIGRPIRNTRFVVLRPDGCPAAIGEEGELYIKGAGLAAGYVNRDDLTAAAFRPEKQGSKRYRTGDLAMRTQDGDFVYLGRVDAQIKMNGYRIEPGEIETAMTNIDVISTAAVVLADTQLVGFYTATDDTFDTASLRDRLAETLPQWMLPARFTRLDALPVTTNGKIDRAALRNDHVKEKIAVDTNTSDQVSAALSEIFQTVLGHPIDPDQMFFEAGANSLTLMQVHAAARDQIAPDLKVVDLFTHPSISQLAAHLNPNIDPKRDAAPLTNSSGKIAIIGASVRLPGAANLADYWALVRDGTEAIVHGPSNGGGHVNAVAMLDNPAGFDPAYFKLSHREACLMDPQQRHLLMGVAQALDHAGIAAADDNKIGLIAGSSENTYHRDLVRNKCADLSDLAFATLHEKDFLTSKIAHLLNLRGPALTIQTACSTSLVAVHQACEMIRSGSADICVAGGAGIGLNTAYGYTHKAGHIYSKDGHCAPFSANASGTLPGNGVAVVVLRDLPQAQAAGDRILGVIAGSAVNNDGSGKVGFSAPSVQGQQTVITAAHRNAGISADHIGYIETHGTATALGDPIEIAALAQALDATTPQPVGSVALGSVKSQIGHMGAGAGVAGLVRTMLSLWHQTLPATCGFSAPHPDIAFETLPLTVNTKARPWPKQRPYAGVSSFGMGGTNAHVVLQPPPPQPAPSPLAWDLPPLTFDLIDCLHPSLESPSNAARLPFADWFQHPAWRRINTAQKTAAPRITISSGHNLPSTIPTDADLIIDPDQATIPRLLCILQNHGKALQTAAAHVIVCVRGGFGPSGVENPDLAMLSGLLRTACIEFDGLRVSLLDMGQENDVPPLPAHQGFARLALQDKRLFLEVTAPVATDIETPASPIRAGLYILTGGNGGIAASLAQKILQTAGTHVLLLSRTGDVPQILANDTDPTRIDAKPIDITDAQTLAKLAKSLRDQGTPINGIIHTAGLAGGAIIPRLTADDLSRVMAPKRIGTLNIIAQLAPLCRDFVVLCSSLSARMPVPGQADYATANAWLDSYADHINTAGPRVISINWPAWRNTGMSARLASDSGQTAKLARTMDAYAIDHEEAWQVFTHALALDTPQVIVNPMPADVQLDLRAPKEPIQTSPETLAQIFARYLELPETDCDPNTSFYDLGGDSLLALDLLDDILQHMGTEIPASALSGDMSITALNAFITDKPPETITPLQVLREGTQPAIVLLHPIGGDVISYRALVKSLPQGRKILAIEDPFLSNTEAPDLDLSQRAKTYLDMITAHCGNTPCTLIGWSFGALIGYEMATQAANKIGELVLIDPPHPITTAPTSTETEAAFLAEITHRKHLGAAPPDAKQTHPYLAGILGAWRRNSAAMRNYRPTKTSATPTTLWLAQDQDQCDARRKAWQALIPALNHHVLPADHFTILQPPHISQIATSILMPECTE